MRHRRIGCAAVVIAAGFFIVVTRGTLPPEPNPAGAWSFAVLGDAPYNWFEEKQYPQTLQQIRANDVAFVVHVGDIFGSSCTDGHYREALGWMNAMGHPVMYSPGDNETCDCWHSDFAPLERWAALRRIFFADPAHSIGRQKMPLVSQGGEFVENQRWTRDGIVFATVDIIGSANGMEPFSGRTAADDAAARRRTEAAAAWTRQAFAEASRTDARAVVIGFQANMHTEKRNPEYTQAFEPFLSTLEREAARFRRPVLLVHGDGHEYIVDHPLRPQNITRMQVPGSPRVGWVRVFVRRQVNPFAFEQHVVPWWKYW